MISNIYILLAFCCLFPIIFKGGLKRYLALIVVIEIIFTEMMISNITGPAQYFLLTLLYAVCGCTCWVLRDIKVNGALSCTIAYFIASLFQFATVLEANLIRWYFSDMSPVLYNVPACDSPASFWGCNYQMINLVLGVAIVSFVLLGDWIARVSAVVMGFMRGRDHHNRNRLNNTLGDKKR